MSTAHPVEEGTSTAGCDEFTAVPFGHLRLIDVSSQRDGASCVMRVPVVCDGCEG